MSTHTQDPFQMLADAIAERVVARMLAEQGPRYLDAREVARRLNRPLRTVHHMARTGAIPSVRQGCRVMFVWDDVRKAVESRP